MIGTTISHYSILEKLGEGGMGVVYKARDTKLDRDVALKFLPAHLAASDQDRARFMQEAKAAAALNHPNVCSIIDIQEYDAPGGGPGTIKQMFIVMEFVDGQTLRSIAEASRRSGIPLPLKRVVETCIQIADGLSVAHAKGVVHRDIKSENVMVTPDGRVKIMDFGLAKIRDSARLTRTAATVGTLPYMAPEQLQGGEASAISDMFSFGVVLYETLTGHLPFQAEHEAATMYRIMNESPDPVRKYRSDVPGSLFNIIEKALRKDPHDRFQNMTELLSMLRESAVSGASAESQPTQSIAVLAFEDMSSEKDQDYFCEGLAEEVINSLTQLRKLRVSSRTSAFAFKGKQTDVREIGRKLNVQHVLEGSVRKAGNRLRVTAQLITVEDGYHVWSERYDRELKDVFEVQDDITAKIVQALRVVLTPQELGALEKATRVNIEAYEYYLKGRKLMHEQMRKSHARAIQMFEQATNVEPRYALAYAGMADCYSFLYQYWESTDANRAYAEKASSRALDLDPDLSEAHLSHGYAMSLSKRFADAEKEFEIALRLNPRLFEAYYYYARTCFLQGKFEQAAKLYEEASAINPEDYQAKFLLRSVYRALNQPEKVTETLREGLRRAERHLELHPDDLRALYLGAGALVGLGQRDRGFEWANRVLAIAPDDPGALYNIACLYSLAGDNEKAIETLEKSLASGFAQKEWIEHDTDLGPIRSHPRYNALLKSMK